MSLRFQTSFYFADDYEDYDYDDEGNIYFIRPDGETQWEDPRDS